MSLTPCVSRDQAPQPSLLGLFLPICFTSLGVLDWTPTALLLSCQAWKFLLLSHLGANSQSVMSLLTLAAVRTALFKYASNVPLASATSDEKAAFDAVLNQCQERFINSGKPRASWARARFAVYDNQITLPRSLETIITGAPVFQNSDSEESGNCGFSYSIFNQWYDISTDAVGNVNACCIPGLVDMGEHYATFRDPGFDFKIRPVPRMTEPGTATILLRGLDSRGQEIFTSTATQGVSIAMNSSSNVTTGNTFRRLTSWVKSAATNGIVDLYAIPQNDFEDLGHIGSIENLNEAIIDVFAGVAATAYDVGDTIRIGTTTYELLTVTDLGAALDARYGARIFITVTPNFGTILPYAVAEYESAVTTEVQTLIASITPGELTSGYRRYAVSANDDEIVAAICKRAYVPAVSDNDFVIPSNLGALKAGLQALQFEDRVDEPRAEAAWARAFKRLEEDRQEYDGDSSVSPLSFVGDFGGGSIPNYI